MSAPTVRRTTARVVPVNAQGEALLMLSRDPARPEVTYWCSFGGAVEEGETLAEAGARELHEETGIEARPEALTEAIHRGVYEFSWAGWSFVSDATFFAHAARSRCGGDLRPPRAARGGQRAGRGLVDA